MIRVVSVFRFAFSVLVDGGIIKDAVLGKTARDEKTWPGSVEDKGFFILYFIIPSVERTSRGLRSFIDTAIFNRLVAMDSFPPNRGYRAITKVIEEAFRRGLEGRALADIKQNKDVRIALINYTAGRLVGLNQLRGILEAIYRLGLERGEDVERALAFNKEKWAAAKVKPNLWARLRRLAAKWRRKP